MYLITPNPDTFTFLCPSVCCFMFIVAKQGPAHAVMPSLNQFILLRQCTFYIENEAPQPLSLLGSGINNDDSGPSYEYTHGSNRELKLKPGEMCVCWCVRVFSIVNKRGYR